MTEATSATSVPMIAIATIVPLPEFREDVRAALQTATEGGHAEDGCLLYALHETPDAFVMIEKWASSEAARAHGQGPVFGALAAAWDGKLATPLSVQRLTPLGYGTPEQGSI
jgi:quinol monooxygenase YgiN